MCDDRHCGEPNEVPRKVGREGGGCRDGGREGGKRTVEETENGWWLGVGWGVLAANRHRWGLGLGERNDVQSVEEILVNEKYEKGLCMFI